MRERERQAERQKTHPPSPFHFFRSSSGDTLLSYGNMARWHSISRIRILGADTGRRSQVLVAGSGNYSAFQEVLTGLDSQLTDEYVEEKAALPASALASYLGRWAYDRHRQGKALVVNTVLAGTRRDKETGETVPYLASVRPNGMVLDTLPFITTGFLTQAGSTLYEAAAVDGKTLTLDEAKDLLREVASLHWKRDAHAVNSFQFGHLELTPDGPTVTVSDPFEVHADWSYGKEAAPYFQQAAATS